MTSSATIRLHIGNAIPHGNEQDTGAIIALWDQLNGFFQQRDFTAQGGPRANTRDYQITLDASALLTAMETARDQSKSFTGHRKAHIENPDNRVDAELVIKLSGKDKSLDEGESYQVATVFLHQLVLTANIILPGSIQILDASFKGPGAHRFEAQSFDSRVLYGAMKTSLSNNWPALRSHSLDSVWNWLESCEVSGVHTAIKDINKVLLTLLKVAEQRHEYSARTVLMIMYQLETLLACRDAGTVELIRNRARLVLGKIPESADCFLELHEVRNSLFLANQPVHRPPLICHNTAEALKEQIGQHNTAVELGTALVLALLQDLIANDSRGYRFTESFSRR